MTEHTNTAAVELQPNHSDARTTINDDEKHRAIVVIDEEEKAILRKIDMQ